MTSNTDIWPPHDNISTSVCVYTQTKPVHTNEHNPGADQPRRKEEYKRKPLTGLLPTDHPLTGQLVCREAIAILFGFLLFHRLFRYKGRLIYNDFKDTLRYSLDQRVAEGRAHRREWD